MRAFLLVCAMTCSRRKNIYFIIFGFLGDAKMATIKIFFIKVYTVSKAERKVELH